MYFKPAGKVVTYLERGTGLDPQPALISIHYAGVETRKNDLDQVIAHPGCTLLHKLCAGACWMNGKPSGRNDFWIFNRYQSSLSPLAKKLNKINFDLRELAATRRTAGNQRGIQSAGPACNKGGSCAIPSSEFLTKSSGPILPRAWKFWSKRWDSNRPSARRKRGGATIGNASSGRRRSKFSAPLSQVPAIFQPLLGELRLWDPPSKIGSGPRMLLAAAGASVLKIIAALGNGQQQVRANAAAWLGRLKFKPAIPALEAALKKERSEVVKGALFDALEALGAPLESYLDREKLAEEAKKEVAKGVPKERTSGVVSRGPAARHAMEVIPGRLLPDVLIWLLIRPLS